MSRKNSIKRSRSLAPSANDSLLDANCVKGQTLIRKRKISTINEIDKNSAVKRSKVNESFELRRSGTALVMGMGDLGQLGLGPDQVERGRPTRIKRESCIELSEDDMTVEVFAGGVHSLCVTKNGEVYTFGCNDEHALGRETNGDEEKEMQPCKIELPSWIKNMNDVKVIQVTAGDSHSAFLTNNGSLFLCGSFRDSSGSIGLLEPLKMERTPCQVLPDLFITKIASGTDHVAALTQSGELYTMGSAEQGQLGRVARHLSIRGGRYGLSLLLNADACRVHNGVKFINVWCGSSSTLALAAAHADRKYPQQVYACGLNNYGQLGLFGADEGETCQYMLSKVFRFNHLMPIDAFALGAHHTIILTSKGSVYAIGKRAYGRLGVVNVSDSLNSDPLTNDIQLMAPSLRSFRHRLMDSEEINGSNGRLSSPFTTMPDVEQHSNFDRFVLDDAVLIPVKVCDGAIANVTIKHISCGTACSFAVDEMGRAYSWGMGSNKQLGNGSEDDSLVPTLITGKQLENKKTLMISSGGQHTMLIAYENLS